MSKMSNYYMCASCEWVHQEDTSCPKCGFCMYDWKALGISYSAIKSLLKTQHRYWMKQAMKQKTPYLWRCEISETTNVPKVYLNKVYIVRETPHGYHLASHGWVSKTSRKRYAYPTKEQAIESFIARKQKQVQILKRQLDLALTGLSLVKTNKIIVDDV
jgi:predicted nucleic-acid-binding Zn-ribbon protein